jgi:hypothetical protein
MIQVPPFYQVYVAKTANLSLLDALDYTFSEYLNRIETLGEDFGNFTYTENKWTINELLQHTIDSERIFVYRALSFARAEKQELPGFDQDDYAEEMYVKDVQLSQIINDFRLCRAATKSMFKNFSDIHLNRVGTANSVQATPEMIGRIIAGHALHHFEIMEERYIPAFKG